MELPLNSCLGLWLVLLKGPWVKSRTVANSMDSSTIVISKVEAKDCHLASSEDVADA